MKVRSQKEIRHSVDFIFPLLVFLIFALCALAILLFATDTYKRAVNSSEKNNVSKTALSYLAEKIHRTDNAGEVSLYHAGEDTGTLDVEEALVLTETAGEDRYLTYIYEYEGSLMELMVKEGSQVAPSAGTVILENVDLSMESVTEGLFRFTCTDADQKTASLLVALRSDAS